MATWTSKIGKWVGALVAVWLVLLLILDAVYGRKLGAVVGERLGESLQGTSTIESTDLALVRGHLDFTDLAVMRDDVVGHLSLKVAAVRCELAPLGIGVVDHDCHTLAVRGTRLEVSTAALFKLKAPKRGPIHTDRVVIDDAELSFSPSAILPGIGRVTIRIDHAECGDTTFHTPIAWLLTMKTLDARIELPAGIAVKLSYRDGVMSAQGTLFGSQPVSVPLVIPVATDAKSQIEALVKMGKTVAEDLVAKRAQDWIDSKF